MERRDGAVLDADPFVDHLDDWCKAVSCAGGGGDDLVLGRVVEIVVDADHNVESSLLDRRGYDNAVNAALKERRDCLRCLELRGRFEHNLDAKLVPGNFARRCVAAEADPPAVGDDSIPVRKRLVLPAALNRIEVQQVGRRSCVTGDLVDLDYLNIGVIPKCAKRKAAHAAKAVNPKANRRLISHPAWFYRRSAGAK